MLQLDPTTQASLEAATTPSARAAAILSSLAGTITITVRDGTGATKGSGTMTSFGTQSANVIVLNNVTSFTVSETGSPDPTTWTIEFATAGGRFVTGTFGFYTSPVAEFRWSLDSWENGQSGTIASAYCTVRKNEVLSDMTDTFEITPATVNTAPIWLPSRPTSLSGTAGSVLQLAQYAYDPDEDSLTYEISSYIPPGYSINSNTGALTIGATTQPITIRVTDVGGLSSDWPVTVTVVASTYKWYPGHYPQADAILRPSKESDFTSLMSLLTATDTQNRITGVGLAMYWGALEPAAKGAYDWDYLDSLLTRVDAAGYKAYVKIWIQSFGGYTTALSPPSTPQSGEHSIPDYIIDEGYWYNSSSAKGVRMWLQPPMDHLIDFLTAFAARYDSDSRLAAVGIEEGTWGVPLDGSASSSTVATGVVTQANRMMAATETLFVNTPFAFFTNFTGTETGNLSVVTQHLATNTMLSTPDLKPVTVNPWPTTSPPVEWNMRNLRGARYVSGTWVEGAATDQRMSARIALEKQVNRSTSWTPQTCYEWARDIGKVHFLSWTCQTAATLYAQPTVRIPAMDADNIIAYLAAADRPLRTDRPGE